MAEPLANDLFEPLSHLVETWMGGIGEAGSSAHGAISLEEIAVDVPVELQLLRSDGALELRASPPTQRTQTSVLPVWHRLRVRYAIEAD